jgi:hypothetical protein
VKFTLDIPVRHSLLEVKHGVDCRLDGRHDSRLGFLIVRGVHHVQHRPRKVDLGTQESDEVRLGSPLKLRE